MTTVTVDSGGGGDYTTIQAAVNAADVSSDVYIVEIIDNAAYDETVDISNVTGTPTASNYVWIRAASGNRHSGVAGTGHARLIPDTASGHAITISEPFTRISHLEIKQQSPGTSDEAIRVTASGDDSVLIHDCIIWTDSAAGDTDGIYAGDWDVDKVSISHCAIYGFRRAGIHAQQFGSTARTQVWNVDYCSIYLCGDTDEAESGAIYVRSDASGDDITVNLNNTWGAGTREGRTDFQSGRSTDGTIPLGTVTWSGSNVDYQYDQGGDPVFQGTNNMTSTTQVTGVVDTTQASGTYIVVKDLTAGSIDLRLLDDAAGNHPIDSGTDRTGSEPDSREPFSTDIEGDTRSGTFDIGADEFVSGGATQLTVQESSHPHTSGTISVTPRWTLSVAESSHPHSSEQLTVTPRWTLSLAGSSHPHTSGAVALGVVYTLSVQESAHAHTSGTIDLTTHVVLDVASSAHGHTSDSISLSVGDVASLTVQESFHAHTSGAIALSLFYSLSVASSTHHHTSGTIDLTTGVVLDVAGSTHGHTSGTISLSTGDVTSLTVQESSHPHTSGALSVTPRWSLSPAESSHAHRSDEMTVGFNVTLAVPDSRHAHTSDPLSIAPEWALSVASSSHPHRAGAISLILSGVLLSIGDSRHGHTSEVISLLTASLGSGVTIASTFSGASVSATSSSARGR